MDEFGLVPNLRVLVTGSYKRAHLEVGLQDDLADHIVHAVELLRLVTDGAATRQGEHVEVGQRIVAGVLALHDYYF